MRRRLDRSARLAVLLPAVGLAFLLLEAPPAGADDTAAAGAFALEVVGLINEERAAIGLSRLAPDLRLFEAAEGHTEWMVATNTFSHRGSGGSTPADRALAVGYSYTALGESLARGHVSPEQVVRGRACDRYCITVCDTDARCDGWKQSPSHWRILMGGSYRDIGSAYLPGPMIRPHWWTVMVGNSSSPTVPLGTPDPELPPPSPTPTVGRTPSPVPTASRTPTKAPTATATSSLPTASPTASAPPPPTWTPMPTRTPRPSSTPSRTPTRTAVPTATQTPSVGTSGVRGLVEVHGLGPRAGVSITVDGVTVATTDAAGRFVANALPSGRRTVEARLDGALASRSLAELLPGVTRDLGTTALVAGDVHVTQTVDLLDLLMVAAAVGRCEGAAPYSALLDLDSDGCVDDDDYLLVMANLGRSGPTAWTRNP